MSPKSSTKNTAALDHNIVRLLNIHCSTRDYNKVFEHFFKDSTGCRTKKAEAGEEEQQNRYLNSAKAALKARMKKTSAFQKHTERGLVAARRTKQCLHHLYRIQNITMEEIKETLGKDNYNNLVDEEMLSEVIEQKAVASRNKNLLVKRFWETTARMMEPEYLDCQELGGLVVKMLIKEADDEGGCEQLLAMEQKNREMLLSLLQVVRANMSLVKYYF